MIEKPAMGSATRLLTKPRKLMSCHGLLAVIEKPAAGSAIKKTYMLASMGYLAVGSQH